MDVFDKEMFVKEMFVKEMREVLVRYKKERPIYENK